MVAHLAAAARLHPAGGAPVPEAFEYARPRLRDPRICRLRHHLPTQHGRGAASGGRGGWLPSLDVGMVRMLPARPTLPTTTGRGRSARARCSRRRHSSGCTSGLHLPPAREIAAQEIAEASWCEVREPAEGAGGAAAATATAVSATAVSATVASAAQGGTVGDSAVGAPTEHAKQSAANPGVANSSPVVGEGSAEGSRAGGGGSSGSVSGGETVLVESRAGGSGGSHHGSDYGSEGSARGGASGVGAGSGACRWRLVSGRVTHATRVADQPRGDYTVYHIEVELEAPTTPVDAKSAHRTDGLSAGNGHAANANGMEAAKNGGEGDHGGIGGGGDASPSISIDLHRSPSIRMGSYSCESVRIRQLGRRYSDFSHLDASIRASGLPNNVVSHLPTLPTTFTFNKFADSVVHARRVALDRYVRALLTAPSSRVLASLPEVQAFFEEVEEDGDVVGAQ